MWSPRHLCAKSHEGSWAIFWIVCLSHIVYPCAVGMLYIHTVHTIDMSLSKLCAFFPTKLDGCMYNKPQLDQGLLPREIERLGRLFDGQFKAHLYGGWLSRYDTSNNTRKLCERPLTTALTI